MTEYVQENLQMFSIDHVRFMATQYSPKNRDTLTTILYFHGGGLIFGNRDDLPSKFIQLFTDAGISLVTVDYPLAPESNLSTIMQVIEKIMDWFINDYLSHQDEKEYFLMGRSAGGYLALKAGLYAQNLKLHPLGIVSLYGYFNLNDASFSFPNPHYLKYPTVENNVINSLVELNQMTVSDDPNRFLIYLAARQQGNWLGTKDEKREFSISKDKLKTLPPIFISAATGDPDVPVRQSRQLANIHPQAVLKLYDVNEHDFDRTYETTLGLDLYQSIVRWIIKLLSH